MPQILHDKDPDGMRTHLSLLPPLIGSSGEVGGPTVPDFVPEVLRPNGGAISSATTNEGGSSWRTTVTATTKSFLRTVKEFSDAFPPLKSFIRGLCTLLEDYEV